MINCFYCLRHYSIICSNNKNYYICYICSPGSHLGKSFMAWSVYKSYTSWFISYVVCANMLCNSTSFTRSNLFFSYIVQQTCFPMVNMAHNSYDCRSCFQRIWIIFKLLRFNYVWSFYFYFFCKLWYCIIFFKKFFNLIII